MTKIIDLRPEKSLIDQNFEKYQYSSDIVHIDLEKTLTKDVYRQEPNNSQESWLEARIFAFHNHLFDNPYNSSSWYVDNNRDVWQLTKYGNLVHEHSLAVSAITATTKCPYAFNPSISFASKDATVLSNGGECLEVLINDEQRNKRDMYVTREISPCVLMDSRYIREESLLIVATCRMNEIEGKKCSELVISRYKHGNAKAGDGTLKLLRKQILRVKGPIEYVRIEASGDRIHAISQDTATLVHDSAKLTDSENCEDSRENESKEIRIPKYCWSQDEDSLTVWIKIPDKLQDGQLVIDTSAARISVSVKNIDENKYHMVLIEGDFQHRLDPDLTTWSREKDTLKLDLVKHESGLMWHELIRGDTGGECLPNEALAAEIHDRLSHLCTSDPVTGAGEGQPLVGFNADQLEECDLQDRDNFLQRIDLENCATTHLVILGSSNHVLFTHKLKSGQRLCLRHDHHGCVWITRENDKEDWDIEHMDTFPGFGYVEASKTNKKFCVSPPNGSYVAIVEHTRHAFIYEKPVDTRPVAKQRIVDIGPDSSPIMGAVATNKHLILLTTKKLYRFVVIP